MFNVLTIRNKVMKANEAPEKIYKTVTYLDERKRGDVKWKDKPVAGAENIEYIQIDAFIEKACSWLKENCKDYIIVDIDNKYEGIDGLFLEDFIKYMKGE